MQPPVDPEAILAAMGQPQPQRATRITGGSDTLIWRIEQQAATYVLRVFRPEQQATWQREQAAHTVAAQAACGCQQFTRRVSGTTVQHCCSTGAQASH